MCHALHSLYTNNFYDFHNILVVLYKKYTYCNSKHVGYTAKVTSIEKDVHIRRHCYAKLKCVSELVMNIRYMIQFSSWCFCQTHEHDQEVLILLANLYLFTFGLNKLFWKFNVQYSLKLPSDIQFIRLLYSKTKYLQVAT